MGRYTRLVERGSAKKECGRNTLTQTCPPAGAEAFTCSSAVHAPQLRSRRHSEAACTLYEKHASSPTGPSAPKWGLLWFSVALNVNTRRQSCTTRYAHMCNRCSDSAEAGVRAEGHPMLNTPQLYGDAGPRRPAHFARGGRRAGGRRTAPARTGCGTNLSVHNQRCPPAK